MARYIICALAIGALLVVPQAAFSQDDEEEIDFNSGTVVSIQKDAGEITLTQYDWDSDSDIEVRYKVAPDVRVENTDAWYSIKPGSYVDFEFMKEEGLDTLVYISVYEVPGEKE